ncbi:MAG: TRAFs-binding domain-containing protein, partial [Rhodothermales bacterium]
MKMSLFLAVLLSMLMAPSLSEAHTATLQSVISGRVWIDANDDGGFDADEEPLPNVQVLLQKDGRAFAETLTNSNGEYQFDGLEPGAYVVTMIDDTLPAEYRNGENEVFPQDIPDDNTDYTIEKNFRITITLIAVPLSVTGQAWADAARQQPLPGVAVQLAHPTGEVLATVTTDNQGRYAFPSNQLDVANWVVSVVQWPAGYTPATPEQIPIRLSLGDPQRVANFGFVSGTEDITEVTGPADTTQVTGPSDTTVAEAEEGTSPWLYIVPLLVLLAAAGAYLFLRRRPPARPAAAPINFLEEFLKFRDEKAWSKMYELLEKMPAALAQMPLVRQQHAFALNRDGHGDKAEGFLKMLLEKVGPSTETNGILGRVYKDRWKKARSAGQTAQAAEHLEEALKVYLAGHAADPTNPYPGLNALTL